MFKQLIFVLALFTGVTSFTYASAPLPAVSKGVAIPPDKGYVVKEISDGLYWLTGGLYTMMFLTTGEGVIVVDAPPSIGKKILAAIKEVTSEPITHVIYTHAHADHIGSAGLFPASAKYIAHEETKKLLALSNRPVPFGVFVGGADVPAPNVTFKDELTLTVGTQTLQLSYRGNDHEPGNIYVYAPKQRVLMKIDIIFPGWTPFKGLAIAQDVAGYMNAHDIILSYEFEHLVSGHWGRLANRKDVEVQKAYFKEITANASQALKSVDFQAIAKKTGYANISLLFDTYLDAVTQKCADLTIPKWLDRLGGADIWTGDHCYDVIMALRVD